MVTIAQILQQALAAECNDDPEHDDTELGQELTPAVYGLGLVDLH
jgi:hypothetical protein